MHFKPFYKNKNIWLFLGPAASYLIFIETHKLLIGKKCWNIAWILFEVDGTDKDRIDACFLEAKLLHQLGF